MLLAEPELDSQQIQSMREMDLWEALLKTSLVLQLCLLEKRLHFSRFLKLHVHAIVHVQLSLLLYMLIVYAFVLQLRL